MYLTADIQNTQRAIAQIMTDLKEFENNRNDLIHQWLIVIPAAFLSAFVFHAPLWVTYACLKSDQVLKCFVAVFKVNRFRWIRVLTREDAPQA